MAVLRSIDLGTVPYREALAIQYRLRDERRAEDVPDTVLVLEHPAVYTRGRRSEPAELPFGEAWYAERGIQIVDVDRGGKVTYHGPGQLVLYPICTVANVRDFVGQLERAIVTSVADEGIEARGRSAEGIEYTGAWVGDRKIGSIGLHVSHGVSMHGLSLNVNCDLEPFDWIVPCGLSTEMTSIAHELSDDRADLARTKSVLLRSLAAELGAELQAGDDASLVTR